MQHADIRRVLAERLTALLESQERLPIQPRPYQCETLASTRSWLEDLVGTRCGYISQATGLGKTWLFSAMVSHCTGLRTLIVVPTKVLIEQTARFIVRFTGGLIGHLSGLKQIRGADGEVIAVRGHEHSDVVITTDESFIKYAAKIAAEFGPHLIVWDECHWGYTASAQRALAMFPEAVILGFSATPDYLGTAARGSYVPVKLDNSQVLYGDPKRLARTHFGTLIDERTARWGIENQWLAPFAWGMVECDIPLEQVPTTLTAAGLDYREDVLQALMAKHWPMIVEVVRRLYGDSQYAFAQRQVFAVCPSVKTAEALAKAIHETGVRSACITGETPDTERNVVLSSYASGEIKFLTSVMVLREGWDAPNAEVCLMLRPTKSRVLYVQSMGRVLRPAPDSGRKVALVVDAFFQGKNLSVLSAPVLFGTQGQPVRERAILVGPKAMLASDGETSSPYLPEGVQPRLVFVHPLELEYWAGDDGMFEANGAQWISANGFAKRAKLSHGAVNKRIREAGLQGRSGRSSSGKPCTFYLMTEVERVCADLKRFPIGPKGLFRADGILWGDRKACAARLRLTEPSLRPCFAQRGVRTQIRRNRGGNKTIFYSIADVRWSAKKRRLFLPHVCKDGFARIQGKAWGSPRRLGKWLGVSYDTIVYRIRRHGRLRFRLGRTGRGVARLYALTDVRRLFADRLWSLPLAKRDGTFRRDRKVWITESGMARRLGVSWNPVRRRIRRYKIRFCWGRVWCGQRHKFYPLIVLRNACRDIKRRKLSTRALEET